MDIAPSPAVGTHPGAIGRPSWHVVGLLLAAFFVLGLGWSLTTAAGGSPDELQHSFRAWSVWNGQLLLDPLPTGGSLVRIGESWPKIDDAIHCFALQSGIPADCAVWPAGQGSEVLAGNSAGRYNPAYYLMVGLPYRFFAPETGMYLARVLASLITAVLLTLAAGALIVRGGSVMARVGLVAALTPMAMFLGGTVNPSGMEIAGAVAGWTGLLLLARHPNHPALRFFAVVTGGGLSAMVVARPASYLWVVVPFVVFLIAAGRRTLRILLRRRAVWVAAGSVAVTVAGCLVWSRLAGTADVTTGPGVGGSLAEALRMTFRNADGWWVQQIGVLGWLDTPPPAAVHWGTVMLAGVVLLPALVGGKPSMRWAVLAAAVATVVVPLAAQTVLYPTTGLIWQGRYTLPLTVGVVIAAGFALDETSAFEARFAGRLLSLCLTLWAGIGILMGFYNLQRYATGTGISAGYSILWSSTPWEAPGGNALAFAVTAAGYAGVAVALGRFGRRAANPRSRPPTDGQGRNAALVTAPVSADQDHTVVPPAEPDQAQAGRNASGVLENAATSAARQFRSGVSPAATHAAEDSTE
jgi:hypothetical protein